MDIEQIELQNQKGRFASLKTWGICVFWEGKYYQVYKERENDG